MNTIAPPPPPAGPPAGPPPSGPPSAGPPMGTPPVTLDISGTPRVPFGRLILVEWRKLVDTRAGLVLLSITAGLVALIFGLVLLIVALSSGDSPTAADWLLILTIPVSMLVPVLAITIVTQEWSQRTAMVTFSLEPSRTRVVLAKLVAVMALGVATILFALALGSFGNVLGAAMSGTDAVWNVSATTLFWTMAGQVLYLLMGFGLGLLLLNSPAAVAIYYVYVWILEGSSIILPGVLYILWFATDWGQSILPWISMRISMLPFQISDSDRASIESDLNSPLDTGALGIARIIVSVFIWVGIPLILGFSRLLRAEVK